MIVPLRAASVARANPSARVRRKSRLGSAAMAEASGDEADDERGSIAPAGRTVISGSGAAGPRGAASRPTAAFLASLLTLRRGG